MSSLSRRLRRLNSGVSRTMPVFSEKELAKPKVQQAIQALREVKPDEPEATPEPVPEPEAPAKAKGTYCTLADGSEHGPFRNQAEAKDAIKATLGVSRMPAGATFSRV